MNQRIAQLCADFESHTVAAGEREDFLRHSVDFFAAAFGVHHDEVAIFELDRAKTILHFLVPEKLRKVGFIPLSSLDSLAARTAREVDVFLENTFATRRHTGFFEKIRLGEGMQPPPQPIQKIISAPLVGPGGVCGVIQISRKGESGDPTLPDFSDEDAVLLVELCRLFGARLCP